MSTKKYSKLYKSNETADRKTVCGPLSSVPPQPDNSYTLPDCSNFAIKKWQQGNSPYLAATSLGNGQSIGGLITLYCKVKFANGNYIFYIKKGRRVGANQTAALALSPLASKLATLSVTT